MAKPKKKMTSAEKAAARVPEPIVVEEEEPEAAPRPAPQKPPRAERRKRLMFLVVGILVLVVISAFSWINNYSHETDEARAALASSDALSVQNEAGWIAFGNPESDTGFVLYPGAKVAAEAYAPLMRELAEEQDMFCAIAKMPVNIALLNPGAIEAIMEAYPQVGTWYIGGHSLGGVAACQWLDGHAADVAGVVLLASYSDADLSQTGLKALCVYGTNDGVMDFEAYSQAKALLPADTREVVLEGGNHAQFGTYGEQGGDGAASMSAVEQRDRTVEAIASWMGE